MGEEPFWARWLAPKGEKISNFSQEEMTLIESQGYNAKMAFETHQNNKALTEMFSREHEAFMSAVRDLNTNQQEILKRLEVLEGEE
ncbi:MAG: hypothetical protein ACYTEQ_19435 [Planctomycetota bacterium]|jgi:uncharacterized protein YeaO (DUF488 family)